MNCFPRCDVWCSSFFYVHLFQGRKSTKTDEVALSIGSHSALISCPLPSGVRKTMRYSVWMTEVRKDLGPDTTFYSWLGLPKVLNPPKRRLLKRTENYPERIIQTSSEVSHISIKESWRRVSTPFCSGKHFEEWIIEKALWLFLQKWVSYFEGNRLSLFKGFGQAFFVTVFVVFVVVSSFQYISLRISRRQDFKNFHYCGWY